MTIVEAIKAVMCDAGRPLTAKEVFDAIVDKNLYVFHAQNPKHVVLMQIRRHCVGIDFPSASPTKHFELHGENSFSPLAQPTHFRDNNKKSRKQESLTVKNAREPSLVGAERELWLLHDSYLKLFRKRMLLELRKLSPFGFEAFSKELLEAYGFQEMQVTSVSGDGGIDGFGKLKVGLAHLNVAFQCKRWSKNNIQRPEIDKFRGASQGDYEQGIFFATTTFSEGAIGASIKRGAIPIVLLDGNAIVNLMIDKKIRVESNVMEIPAFAL